MGDRSNRRATISRVCCVWGQTCGGGESNRSDANTVRSRYSPRVHDHADHMGRLAKLTLRSSSNTRMLNIKGCLRSSTALNATRLETFDFGGRSSHGGGVCTYLRWEP